MYELRGCMHLITTSKNIGITDDRQIGFMSLGKIFSGNFQPGVYLNCKI